MPAAAEGREHEHGHPEAHADRPGRAVGVVGSGETVTYSPGVPFGATGGATWSKKPSFSSYMWKSTVLDHTSGFDTSAESTWLVNHSPSAGGDDGCSS